MAFANILEKFESILIFTRKTTNPDSAKAQIIHASNVITVIKLL